MRWKLHYWVIIGAIALPLIISGCDSTNALIQESSEDSSDSVRTSQSVPDQGSGECPEEADYCVEITEEKRQDLIDALEFNTRTDHDPYCANLVNQAKQFIQYGEVMLFEGNVFDYESGGRILGYFGRLGFPDGHTEDRMSFSNDLWQGWSSHRAPVSVHEAAHQDGHNEQGAEYWDDYCIEW